MSEIILKDISIVRKNNEILKNVNFTLNKGEFVYIKGNTGSGKSSLIRSLYCDVPVNSGDAVVCGYDLTEISKKEIPFLRRKLGIVFQDYQLLQDRNIFENLKFVMEAVGISSPKAIKNRVGEMLEIVELTESENKMPFELSGGEQQRAVIARALINEPEIILADEPTGNLDPDSSERIIEILQNESKKGTAVVVATHNHELIKKYPAKTYKIEKGKFFEEL